jgi:hypothetical protein
LGSLIDDIRKALQGEKKSDFIDQILKEEAFYDALRKAGLTVTAADPTERGRLQPFGVLSKVMKIDLVDLITEITNIQNIGYLGYIDFINRIQTIDLITKLSQLDVVDVINSIKNLDKIGQIIEIGKINAFGEVGTWLPFSKTVTSDILTPTAGYKLQILSAFYYCRDDIYTELRFKTSGNLVLGLPTLGSIGMNPFSLTKPLGATDEILEIYMSAGGYVKGWIIYTQIAGTGTAHSKTVSEILGLADAVTKQHLSGGEGWTTPSAIHSKCGQSVDYPATNAIDGNTETYWTHYSVEYHWIIFDMGSTKTITKIKLFQVGGTPLPPPERWGSSGGITVYVGDDPANLGDAVWEGALNADGWQESGAFSKAGRYIKLVSKYGSKWERMYEFQAFTS